MDERQREGKGTDRGELAGEEVPVLAQHVGDHDGRQVHVLVGIGWDQAVGREAVAQRVVSSFVVHQVQQGRVGEVGRRDGRDLVVLVALILTAVRLKHQRDSLQPVTAPLLQQRKVIASLRNADSGGNGFVGIERRHLQACTAGCDEEGLGCEYGTALSIRNTPWSHLRHALPPLSLTASLLVFESPKPQQKLPHLDHSHGRARLLPDQLLPSQVKVSLWAPG